MCVVIVSPCSRINCSVPVPRNWLFLWPSPATRPLPVPAAGLITVRGCQETRRGLKRGPGGCLPPVWQLSAHKGVSVSLWASQEPPVWPCVLSQASYTSGPHWTLVSSRTLFHHVKLYYQNLFAILRVFMYYLKIQISFTYSVSTKIDLSPSFTAW